MEQSKNILVNRLPAPTWNRLGVNGSALTWDASAQRDLGRAEYTGAGESPVWEEMAGEGAYSARSVAAQAGPGETLTLFEICRAERNLRVSTRLRAEKDARVRLVQLQLPGAGGLVRSEVDGVCLEGGRIELVQILLGRGDFSSESRIDLRGDGASLGCEIGYLGQGTQHIDMNLVADHYGRNTKSEITAAGALKDAAEKIFRGTIDFKRGSAGGEGSEQETVLMLGEDAVNKTVPLILCAEENVAGTHGATIGEMDDATAFYFESRGIDRKKAENMLSRAAIERLARAAGDGALEERILRELDEVLRDED